MRGQASPRAYLAHAARLPDPTIFDAASFVSATPENEWCPLSFRQPADLRRITTHRRMRTERGNFFSSERRRTAAGGFEPGTPVPRPRPTAVISRGNGAMHGDADACRAQCALRSAHAVEVMALRRLQQPLDGGGGGVGQPALHAPEGMPMLPTSRGGSSPRRAGSGSLTGRAQRALTSCRATPSDGQLDRLPLALVVDGEVRRPRLGSS